MSYWVKIGHIAKCFSLLLLLQPLPLCHPRPSRGGGGPRGGAGRQEGPRVRVPRQKVRVRQQAGPRLGVLGKAERPADGPALSGPSQEGPGQRVSRQEEKVEAGGGRRPEDGRRADGARADGAGGGGGGLPWRRRRRRGLGPAGVAGGGVLCQAPGIHRVGQLSRHAQRGDGSGELCGPIISTVHTKIGHIRLWTYSI